jgi:UDP-N-acetylglucosamine pyrophosphorylase
MDNQIIILAAGKGSRMQSDLPKVMHKIAGKSMLERVVENCNNITDDLVLVYSDHLLPYLSLLGQRCNLVLQEEQLGTAHAVSVAMELIDPDKVNAVIYGDNPLITPVIIKKLLKYLDESAAAVVTLALECTDPNQYGRIITGANGEFKKIVEFKFATAEEKAITLCNSGIMAFAPGILTKYITKCLTKSAAFPNRELYLTDIIEVCSKAGEKVSYYTTDETGFLMGVNTKEELERADKLARKFQNNINL